MHARTQINIYIGDYMVLNQMRQKYYEHIINPHGKYKTLELVLVGLIINYKILHIILFRVLDNNYCCWLFKFCWQTRDNVLNLDWTIHNTQILISTSPRFPY